MVGVERIQMHGAIKVSELVSLVQGYMEGMWEHLLSLEVILERYPVSMETAPEVRRKWMRRDGTKGTFVGRRKAWDSLGVSLAS